MSEATAAATRMQQVQQQQQQEGMDQESSRFVDDGPDLAGTSALSATKGRKVIAKDNMGGGQDDDWGNEVLGDDLLPL